MFAGASNSFSKLIDSIADGTRPGTSFGTSVTPAQNSYGSYAQLLSGANVTDDVWAISLCVNSVNVAGASRNVIITVGYDPAGGTSYTDTDQHLLVGPAGAYSGAASNGGPVWFYLPRRLRAGTSIGLKGSVNSADLTAFSAYAQLWCRPRRPELARAGAYVDTLGATTASSSGTAVTPGTTSDGSWTQIGTLTRSAWYLAWGVGVDDSTMSNNVGHVDISIGDASNKRIVVSNGYFFTAANEAIGKPAQGAFVRGSAGDVVYARMQVGPNAADSNYSVAVYAVGG